ncbi:hypothetical protein E2C01_022779 [Portunus trituberculatus]|uniref:Uncharacterized protein n=1 Tax=Portunus trituberculatus TaxID=210409 RepID=A0A5B7E6B1_PORTR|nr:hypothetical protein [Portunus trituberculatus]
MSTPERRRHPPAPKVYDPTTTCRPWGPLTKWERHDSGRKTSGFPSPFRRQTGHRADLSYESRPPPAPNSRLLREYRRTAAALFRPLPLPLVRRERHRGKSDGDGGGGGGDGIYKPERRNTAPVFE